MYEILRINFREELKKGNDAIAHEQTMMKQQPWPVAERGIIHVY
jgi:hypothetical protein